MLALEAWIIVSDTSRNREALLGWIADGLLMAWALQIRPDFPDGVTDLANDCCPLSDGRPRTSHGCRRS